MARDKLCVGLDIGASAIKLCQLKKNARGYTLESFGLEPLPVDTVVDGALMNSAHVVEALQALVERCKIKNKQVALAISGHAVIIKKISLPQMSRDALDKSINWEAEQFIPFDINDVYTDVQILGASPTQVGQMEVLLVAAKKDFVDEYTAVVAEAGLLPTICDVDAFAIQSLYEANYVPTAENVVALINIGAAKTSINIVQHHNSLFTRHLSVGGNAFTEELQRSMGLGQAEAEQLKLAPIGLSQAASAGLSQIADSLSADIARSIDYATSTSGSAAPKHYLVSGGSAALPMLLPALQRHSGVPVSQMDLLRKIVPQPAAAASLDAAGAAAAVAVGLGLRYLGDGNA